MSVHVHVHLWGREILCSHERKDEQWSEQFLREVGVYLCMFVYVSVQCTGVCLLD